jgi:hypothetical protein
MAAGTGAETLEVLGIRGVVGNTGIDGSPGILHESGQAGLTPARARRGKDEPQALLDEVLELPAAQRRTRFGAAIEIVWHLDRGLHGAIIEFSHKPINP